MREQIPCRSEKCERMVTWARNTRTGKPVPLDGTPPIYAVFDLDDGETVAVQAKNIIDLTVNLRAMMDPANPPAVRFMVSHFATCKEPERFSGRGR